MTEGARGWEAAKAAWEVIRPGTWRWLTESDQADFAKLYDAGQAAGVADAERNNVEIQQSLAAQRDAWIARAETAEAGVARGWEAQVEWRNGIEWIFVPKDQWDQVHWKETPLMSDVTADNHVCRVCPRCAKAMLDEMRADMEYQTRIARDQVTRAETAERHLDTLHKLLTELDCASARDYLHTLYP